MGKNRCQYEKLDRGLGQGLLESLCEYDIEPPGSISHGVGYLLLYLLNKNGVHHRNLITQMEIPKHTKFRSELSKLW